MEMDPVFSQLLIHEKDDDGVIWVDMESFIKYLGKNQSKNDSMKHKPANIRRVLRNYQGCSKKAQEKECISSQGILRYIYQYCDMLEICKSLSEHYTRLLSGHCHSKTPVESQNIQGSFGSIKGIYDFVASTPFKDITIGKQLQHEMPNEIPSLYSHLQHDYDEESWNRIKFFELHYSQQYGDICSTVDEEIQRKTEYLNILAVSKNLAQNIKIQIATTLARRKLRTHSAEMKEKIMFSDSHQDHIYETLDADVNEAISNCKDIISTVFCAEATIPGTIMVLSETLSTDKDLLSNAALAMKYSLQRKHNVQCTCVIFYEKGCFKPYQSKLGISRFKLRESSVQNSENLKDIYRCSWERDDSEPANEDTLCDTCLGGIDDNNLSLTNFDLIKEWLNDVPLPMQVILESFINLRSLNKSSDMNSYLKDKIKRLYSTVDVLLNVHNKYHFGIYQQANTNELIMHSSSITAVFKVSNVIY